MRRRRTGIFLPFNIRYMLLLALIAAGMSVFSAAAPVWAAEEIVIEDDEEAEEEETDPTLDEDEEDETQDENETTAGDEASARLLASPLITVTERVLDSAGNDIDGSYARLGDTLTFIIDISNNGDGAASACIFTGDLADLGYYGLSVTDSSGEEVTALTTEENDAIRIAFGTDADDNGGLLAAHEKVTIRFQAVLHADPGEQVENQCGISFKNASAGILDILGSSISSNPVSFEVDMPVIRGTVWVDANNNGLIEDNEYPISGQTMVLQVKGADGAYNNYVSGGAEVTTETDNYGNYSFYAVPAGVYRVAMYKTGFEAGISVDTATPSIAAVQGTGQHSPNNNAVNLVTSQEGATVGAAGIDLRPSAMKASSECWCDFVDFGLVPIVTVRQEVYVNDSQVPAVSNGEDNILVWPGYTVRFRLILTNPAASLVGPGPSAEQLTLRGGVSVTEILPAGLSYTEAAGNAGEVNGSASYEGDSHTIVWNPAALPPGETWLDITLTVRMGEVDETYETCPEIRTGGGVVYRGNTLVLECGSEGLLAVVQKVSGEFANLDRAFSYTIVIGDEDTPLGQWIGTIDRRDGSQETVFIKAGEPVCISLSNNEDIRIPHVPVSAGYSIGQVPVYNYTAQAVCMIDGRLADSRPESRDGRLFYDGSLRGSTTAVTYTDELVAQAPSVTNGILMGTQTAQPGINIIKVLETKSRNEARNTNFTFNLTPVSVGDGSAALMPQLEPVTVSMAEAEDLGAGDNGLDRIVASAALPVNAAAFPHAGIYTYSLTEDNRAPYGNIAYSGEEYILKFYVANDSNGLFIRYVEYWMNGDATEMSGDEDALAAYFRVQEDLKRELMGSENEDREVTGIVFHNLYEPTTSLQVKNTVRGSGADADQSFGCTVRLELPDKKTGNRSYTAFIFNEDGTVAADAQGHPLAVIFDPGNGNTATGAFTLLAGQYLSFVSISNGREQSGILPLGTKFGVMESTVENYTSSVSLIVDGKAVTAEKAADGFYYGLLGTATVPGENCLNIVRTSEHYSVSEAVFKGLPYGLAFAFVVVIFLILFRKLFAILGQRREAAEKNEFIDDFDDDE